MYGISGKYKSEGTEHRLVIPGVVGGDEEWLRMGTGNLSEVIDTV